MDLSNRNIVITGGTSGIGLELVRRLQDQNHLFVIARNAARLDHLRSQFPGIMTCRADLASSNDLAHAAAEARARFERIDVLLNNAAIQYMQHFTEPEFEPTSIEREIAINFTAVFTLCARLLPAMIHEGRAAIVNVNSGLALVPKTSSAVYCATKGAMNIFSQALRYQLAPTNVRVQQAFMPLVDTPMTAGRGAHKMSAHEAADALLRGISRGIDDHDIGKVRLLRVLMRFLPGLARKIMRDA
ncbi:MAG: SDR family NAD(P)-dependent oxidoreductase [Pseudomonadota bacterium]